MFIRTKKRAFPSQIPLVRHSLKRSRPNIKAKRRNQFLGEDDSTEKELNEPEHDGFFNLEDNVSSILNSDNDSLPQTVNDSDNNSDNNDNDSDNDSDNSDNDSDNSDDDSDNSNNNNHNSLLEDNDVILPQTEDNDGSLPQAIEDEQNAHFEPIQGKYGPYFNNFTEQMLFFWTTKHMIGR